LLLNILLHNLMRNNKYKDEKVNRGKLRYQDYLRSHIRLLKKRVMTIDCKAEIGRIKYSIVAFEQMIKKQEEEE